MLNKIISGFNLLGKFAPVLVLTSGALTAGILILVWNFLTPIGFGESLILVLLSIIFGIIMFFVFFLVQFFLFLPWVLKSTAGQMAKGVKITIRRGPGQPPAPQPPQPRGPRIEDLR